MRQRRNKWTAVALLVGALGWVGAQDVGAAGYVDAADGAGTEAEDAIRPPIDINVAGVEELQRLPGIGAVTARRIVAFRDEHGAFRRVEDLMKIKGIGEKSFQRLRQSVTVGVPEA